MEQMQHFLQKNILIDYKMNFSERIKNEILNNNWNEKEQDVIFCIVFFLLSYKLKNEIYYIKIKNEKIFLFFMQYLKNINKKELDLKIDQEKKIFFLSSEFLFSIKNKFLKIEEEIYKNQELNKALIAGAFLAKGSITNFSTKNNYLEIRLKNNRICKLFIKINNKLNFKFNYIKIKNINCFYIKRAIYISDFLKYIKATDSLIDFEENRIIQDMNLNLKRAEVIEKFNQAKINKNAKKEIEAISIILNEPKYLRELTKEQINLAKLRMEKKNSSLEDLKYHFFLKYQKNISKSTIYNWLNKMIQIIEK